MRVALLGQSRALQTSSRLCESNLRPRNEKDWAEDAL